MLACFLCILWGVALLWIYVLFTKENLTTEDYWFYATWIILIFGVLSLFDGVPWGSRCVIECNGMAMDLGSYLFIVLRIWLGGTVLLIRMRGVLHKDNKRDFYVICLCSLILILFFCFSCSNVLWFYVLYEARLIPTSILIISWGDQPERLDAARYIICYTVMCSAPLFFGLMWLRVKGGTSFMWFVRYKPRLSRFLWLALRLGLLVKLPVFPLHVWLPKAHVEAPVGGSLLLAGILLKIGGYGLFRVIMVYGYVLETFGHVVIRFCLWGGVYTRILCLRQVDVKALIAYSSVGHMGMACAGIFTMSETGWNAALGLIIVHAFVSCGLFTLARYGYEAVKTRRIFLIKGLCSLYPRIRAFWFLFCFLNMGCPPSLGVLREIMISGTIIGIGGFLALMPILFLLLFGGAYNLYLYSETQHGVNMEGGFSAKYSVSDFRRLIRLLFWSVVLVLKGGIIVGWMF